MADDIPDSDAEFMSITGTPHSVAQSYLTLTEGNLEQAIQLYFEDPSLGSAAAAVPSTSTASASTSNRPPPTSVPRAAVRTFEDDDGVVHIDSDGSDDGADLMDVDDEQEEDDVPPALLAAIRAGGGGAQQQQQPSLHDDEAMARRLQQEMYGAGHGGQDDEGIRAPMARTTETLVGPDFEDEDVSRMIQQQLSGGYRPSRGAGGSSRRRERAGIFNQRDTQADVWVDPDLSTTTRADLLARATDGQSTRSTKQNTLAEMFRPPFEIMTRLPLDQAREQGKDEEKWLLVNVQKPSIFDCQLLNRDLWKNKDIQDTIRENFIFLQYGTDDHRGRGYIQYYFANSEHDDNAYPHIAIVDPRTGEQVKVWSGRPIPNATDFLMQLYEFLDRYSLNEDAKNPVARRKMDKPKDIERMSEEEMLEMALQNSLAPGNGPTYQDPDELTKSITLDKGKTRASEEDDLIDLTDSPAPNGTSAPAAVSPFAGIASDRPHEEPAHDPATTTRIQFRFSGGREVRRFAIADPVSRIYEWLKAADWVQTKGGEFELRAMGKDLIDHLDETIESAGLKNGTVMIEFTNENEGEEA